jgi:hypothetical protein
LKALWEARDLVPASEVAIEIDLVHDIQGRMRGHATRCDPDESRAQGDRDEPNATAPAPHRNPESRSCDYPRSSLVVSSMSP